MTQEVEAGTGCPDNVEGGEFVGLACEQGGTVYVSYLLLRERVIVTFVVSWLEKCLEP